MDNVTRFNWLATREVNSIHLGRNDEHACNYMTAAQWIEAEFTHFPGDAEHCTEDELQRMRDTDTIWSLQIYPKTPNGFVRWIAPTLEELIDKAMADWPDVQKSYPGLK